MSLIARVARTLTLASLLTAGLAPAVRAQPAPAAQAPTTTAAQEEYVPIAELPDSEKLPAAPFLISAYVIVWGALLVYVWTLWKRLGRVEAELRQAQRLAGGR
jgi:CcmD family protein